MSMKYLYNNNKKNQKKPAWRLMPCKRGTSVAGGISLGLL